MFKVGDRVSGKSTAEVKIENGKINTVRLLTNGTKAYGVSFIDDFHGGDRFQYCLENKIKLAEPQYTWTSKFNIGDKVVYNGEVVTIEEICFIKSDVEYCTEYKSYKESELTLYKEPIGIEMTVGEIEKKLGYKIKIIKEG